MSATSQRDFPASHPYHGRPLIIVHDHDILLGRGVNIAQHPGNERFRALVSARKDDSYCTNFSLSEKRALAEEVVAHIKGLDPPGRFLKRMGRVQGSRGLSGPWEEVPHRECIRKTCQALRDCNRQDRTGYAMAVSAPSDVALSIQERAKSGLSLKEHAAAVAAEANRAKQYSNPASIPPVAYTSPGDSIPGTLPHHDTAALEFHLNRGVSSDAVEQGPFNTRSDNLSPMVGLAAQWLKKQQMAEPHSLMAPSSTEPCHFGIPVATTSSPSRAHSTPTPLRPPIPVTQTPGSHAHHDESFVTHPCYLSSEHLLAPHETDSPQFDITSEYHAESMAPAPYSPVTLQHRDEDVDHTADLDPHSFSFHANDHEDHHGVDLLSGLNAGNEVSSSSLLGHHSNHHRNNSLILDEDVGPHDTLDMSDL